MAQFPVSTIAQLFEVAYNSSLLKKIASALSILSLFLVLITQVLAMKKLMVSLGVSSEALFLFFWGIVILYTVMGGFNAVVATDVVQALFFIAAFAIALVSLYWTQQTLAWGDFSFPEQGGGEVVSYASWILMPLLFMILSQDMGQRCFSARSGNVVSLASAGAAILLFVVCLIPIGFGVLGKAWGIPIPEGGSALLAVVGATTSPVVTAIVGAGLLAAIISTADSLLNAIASNVTQDFVWKRGGTILFSRTISAVRGLGALILSYAFTNIVGLMVVSYELSVSCLVVPVIGALFRKHNTAIPAFCAIVGGVIGFLLFRFWIPPLPREIATVLLSSFAYGLGSLLSWIRTKDSLEQDFLQQKETSPPALQ